MMAVILLIVLPLIYYNVTNVLSNIQPNPVGSKMFIYILMVLSVIQPSTYLFLEKSYITMFKKNKSTKMTVYNLFFTCNIVKFALIDAIYIYGLVSFFLLGTTDHLWKFYIIGIFWAIIYWPRKTTLENFITKAGNDGIQG